MSATERHPSTSASTPTHRRKLIGRVARLSQVKLRVLVLDQEAPDRPVEIDIAYDGRHLQRLLIDGEMKLNQGRPAGRVGSFTFPAELVGTIEFNKVSVTFAATGKHLDGSPASDPLLALPGQGVT